MNNLILILPLLFLLGGSCQNEKEKTIDVAEVQYETNPKCQLSHIELNDDEFKFLLQYMYNGYQDDSLKDLTLIEQEAVFRISNTYYTHSVCYESHSFYDSEESENYAKCKFNQNFEEQFKEQFPDYVDHPSMSGYYVSALSIWLWRGGHDNFMHMCPRNLR
ncbi:MAG: hypothetical protein H6582_03575 [Crocinitomicaceae bacterium]|nr:hypothetical protein [Crocinitomicaceae bacterium]